MNRFVFSLAALFFAFVTPAAAQSNSATLQFTRPSVYMYALPDAYIDVNGTRMTNLANGSSYKGSVKPGPVTIVVTNWQSPGRSTLSFRAVAGKTYRFTIAPRTQNLVATVAGGLIGQAIEGGGMFQITRN